MPADSAWNVSLTEWNTVVESVVKKKKKKIKKKKRSQNKQFLDSELLFGQKKAKLQSIWCRIFMEGKDTFTKQNKNIGMHSMPELLFLS